MEAVLAMFTELQRSYNPLRECFAKMFTRRSVTIGPAVIRSAITLANLAAMPKQAQLLLAHFLEQNTPELMLRESDTDVCKLLSTGWLTSIPCLPVGFIGFTIEPHVWHQLRS